MADKDEAQVLADAAKLPLDERVGHSNWKVRSAAYDAIKAGCNSVFNSEDPVLGEYAGLFPKATTDGNAAALDKALEALQAFLEKAPDGAAARFAGSVSSNIVKKTCGARPSTAAKGVDCLMGLVELEQAEKVLGALIEGYTNKVPKVVVGALDATLLLIRSFGAPTVPVKQLIKDLQPLFESKDVKARDKVKEIVVEMARWIGPDAIRATMLGNMRDAMKEDVEKLLQEIAPGRPRPERLTRKEAAKAAAAAAAAADTDAGAAGEGGAAASDGPGAAAAVDEPEQVDSYEFAEPKDIIPELKKDFWDGLASAKWSERKAALTSLKELACYPHLANGDYFDVNREIKKIINKDSNIQVVAEAMNCTAAIAKGLRRDYKGAAMSLCSALLEKFKDKATVVNRASTEALVAMARYCFALADVAEDIAAALAHQNPKVKEGTLNWLTGCVARETKQGVTKLMPMVVPAAAKCTDDGAPTIREAAFGFLVQTALKAGSLTVMDKALSCMDEAKRKKLEEMVQAAAQQGGGAGGAKRPGAAARPAAAAASRSSSRGPSQPASRADSPTGSPRVSNAGPSGRPAAGSRTAAVRSSSTNSRPGTGGARTRSAAAAAGGSSGGGSAAAGGGSGAGAEEDEAALSGGLMNSVEAKARFAELAGEELVAALADPLWKTRLEAMERVVALAQEPAAADNTAVLVQAVAHLPGWDEKNFQVMSKQFEVVRTCAAYPTFTKREALVAVVGGVDKVADLKLKEHSFSMMLAAAEAVGPQLVASLLYKRSAAHKNPKVLTETFVWIRTAVSDFLLPAFNVKSLIDWAKEGLGNANSATRTAAVQLLGTLHAFLGPALGDMVRPDLKPASMATVEAEFEKQPQRSDWQATRVSRAAAKASGGARAGGGKARAGGGGGASAAAAADEPPSMDDLLPRADISGQLAGEVIGKLGSANWKERKEGLDEVEAILAAAGGRIQPCVGDLMPALKARFQDANRNLGAQALLLLASLARAMGRPIAREARPILGPAVKCMCDAKTQVRAAVIEVLEAWVSVAPADAPFDEVVEVLPSPKCVSEGMQAALSWMASVYAAGKGTGSECVATAAKAAAIGAAYKTVPVREAASALLEAMANTLGLAGVQRAVQGVSDKALSKAASDALAKIAAAGGGSSGGSLSAGPSQASGVGARPPTPSGGSRPGTASSSRAALSRPGSAGGVSRPGTASSGAALRGGLAPSGSVLSRPGTASAAAAAAASAAAAAAPGGDGPLLAFDRNKEERAKKIRFKSSKFEIRHDEAQQLEAELGALVPPGFKSNLFAKDFKKQVLAADMLKGWVTSSPDEALDPCIASLDLLLRWCVLRLADGNTQTLVSVTGMLKALFELLASSGYRLTDAEVKVFMPGLVEKCGQPQPNVKADCRDLMVRVAAMHPPAKVLPYIQEGLNSKNNRSRVACAEEIGCLIEREGPKVYSGAKCDVFAVLAKLLAESGKEIRASALKTLEVAYEFQGEALWKGMGNLNGQQKGMLEERFKTVDRELSKKGLAPGYKRAAFEASAAAAAAAATPNGNSLTSSQDGPLMGGAGGSAAAGGGFYAVPGQLSREAGLISLSAAAPEAAAAMGRPNNFSLQTGDVAGGSQHPSMLLTGPPGSRGGMAAAAAAAGGGSAAMMQTGAHDMSVQIPEGHASGQSAPSSANPAAPKYQPLQSFGSQADIHAEWDKCLLVLQNGPMEDVIEVMKLLCYEMMEIQRQQQDSSVGHSVEIVWTLLSQQIDPLVVLLSIQTGQVFTTASAAMAAGPGHLQPVHTRGCKYALNTLMNIFNANRLPSGLKKDTLGGLVRTLLLRLVDDNLGKQAEGEALLKALNVLMLKILENSNRNHVFSALLGLLLDRPSELLGGVGGSGATMTPQVQMQQARWADLVVKCLIKSTKALPQVIETIDLRSLLLSIHGFFEALGVDEIRRRSQADDKPLRMVKTILHELCKLLGTEIYRYTADIPQHGSTSGSDGKPVIFPYIDLNIQTLQGNGHIRSSAPTAAGPGSAAAGGGGMYGQAGAGVPAAGSAGGMGAASSCSATPGRGAGGLGRPAGMVPAPADMAVARLSNAFTRIASKDISERRTALLDIYNVSQELGAPADKLIEQYNPDLTGPFKEWLVAELNKIHEQQQQQQQQRVAAAAGAGGGAGPPAAAHASTAESDSDASSPWRPTTEQQQQQPPQPQPPPAAAAAPGRLPAAGGGGGGGIASLRARMNQLQASKPNTHMVVAGPAHGSSVPGTLLGTAVASELPGGIAANKTPGFMAGGTVVEGGVSAISDGGFGVHADQQRQSAEQPVVGAAGLAAGSQQQQGGVSIAELKNRFHGMHLTGQQ